MNRLRKFVALSALVLGPAALAHAQESARPNGPPPNASTLLFEEPQLQDAAPGTILAYSYSRKTADTAQLGPSFDDHVRLTVERGSGHNNRTVALRLPCADSANQRIEYRLAGADANPYLALAVMLGGLLHGLEQPLPLPPAANGCESDNAAPLPLGQQEALALFRHSDPLRELLGPAFCTLWHTCKSAELRRFEEQVTAAELGWML